MVRYLGFREEEEDGAAGRFGRLTSNTGDTIYPASGPRRENPTCCLSDLVFEVELHGAARGFGGESRPLAGAFCLVYVVGREID